MLRIFLVMILFLTVVFVLLPQIVWFLTWITGKIFRFPVKYAPFGWTSLGLAVFVWIVLAYGFFIGRWKVETTQWAYENKDIPAAFDGMKIVHISDMHLSTFADNPRQLQRIVDRINAAEPDLICFTGDIVSLTLDEITPYTDVLSGLKATYGVCSVLGNHDFFLYVPQYQEDSAREAAVDSLTQIQRRELGWHLLRNESYAITCGTDTLTILGIDNNNGKKNGFRTICRGDLPKALNGTNGFRILISHDPTFWTTDVVAKTDIPLTLSGHTHSAQVRLFGWTPASWVFEETAGRYDIGNQTLYINIGLGCTAPVRYGANPEITILTLKK